MQLLSLAPLKKPRSEAKLKSFLAIFCQLIDAALSCVQVKGLTPLRSVNNHSVRHCANNVCFYLAAVPAVSISRLLTRPWTRHGCSKEQQSAHPASQLRLSKLSSISFCNYGANWFSTNSSDAAAIISWDELAWSMPAPALIRDPSIPKLSNSRFENANMSTWRSFTKIGKVSIWKQTENSTFR